jgi:hypothetical protein
MKFYEQLISKRILTPGNTVKFRTASLPNTGPLFIKWKPYTGKDIGSK